MQACARQTEQRADRETLGITSAAAVFAFASQASILHWIPAKPVIQAESGDDPLVRHWTRTGNDDDAIAVQGAYKVR